MGATDTTTTLDLGSRPLEEVIAEIFNLAKCSTEKAEGLCLDSSISNSLQQERVECGRSKQYKG